MESCRFSVWSGVLAERLDWVVLRPFWLMRFHDSKYKPEVLLSQTLEQMTLHVQLWASLGFGH